MTEADVLMAARALVRLVQDACATLARLDENGWLTPEGRAVCIAWWERAERAVEEAEAWL